ncbi:putative defense protein 3 [Amphibalanus amphitrite]|uniref:putative defense protein 3 n=1 Tax=Amphibalanus amphitrite TaxID=1232801 RepID=UPI001C926B68|nr:putative defense protein 3 [Amphibalanus amphitrite]XP_043191149.1 putative defense protein 3 [Amphibalanus amphitrite]
MTAALRPLGPLRPLLLAAVLCAVPLAAFPNGAPTEACLRGMVPNHRGARSGNIASMPFRVTRQTTGSGVRVTIEPLQANTYFRGFMVMAREPRGRSWAKDKGAWQPVSNVNLLNECSSITHADRSEKARVSVTWKGDPNVDLYATVVQSYDTFWAEIPVEEAAPNQRVDSSAPQRAVVTNRPFERPEFAPIVDQSRFNVQEFFRQQ